MRHTTHLLRVLLAALAAVVAGLMQAHVVDDVEMRVVVNDLGNARVVEVRQCDMGSSGTEGFIKHGSR